MTKWLARFTSQNKGCGLRPLVVFTGRACREWEKVGVRQKQMKKEN